MWFCRCAGLALLALACTLLTGCLKSESYEGIPLTDSRLSEFNDLFSIDREKLGLCSLPPSADIEVERKSGSGSACDAMLHVYAKHQQRTIAFRREDGKYKWIHEQVTVSGPRQYTTVDGTFNEQITLTYETSPVAYDRLNQLNVLYWGPDAELRAKSGPTLSDVQPLLDEWLQRP